MRVVAGTFKGRTLAVPRQAGLRPTSDRVRESVFNVLAHGIEDFEIEGAVVLDLFAGTGALGLEAISRGAAMAVFVENDFTARALIQENITALGIGGITRIFRRDATNLGASQRRQEFALVFADPPYGQGLAQQALASALAGDWLTPGAVVVVEERADVTVALPPPLEAVDHRTYGDTQVIFARMPRPAT